MPLKFLILVLSIFIFTSCAFAEQIPDYNKPYAPIYTDKPVYTWTDKVRITVVAPSWNSNKNLIDSIGSDSDNPIKIFTRNHSLEPYRLTETNPNSGVFSGEVILSGFSHDVTGDGRVDTTPRTFGTGPTNGYLETERDSAITITFEFADGVILTQSALIQWNVGVIFFLNDNYFSNDQAVIRVIDPDMNLNPEALDHIPIKVFSDSDSAGIIIDEIEISEEAGVFEGKVFFSQSMSSSGSRLYAKPGDSIFAKYNDYTLPAPYSINDNLEIITQTKMESNIPTLERVLMSDIKLTDRTGMQQDIVKNDSQIQIVGTIRNEQEFDQGFVFLIQILDSQKRIASLSWVSGTIEKFQKLDVSQSWITQNSGDYTIQTFVWDSLSSATPLSNPQTKSIRVQ